MSEHNEQEIEDSIGTVEIILEISKKARKDKKRELEDIEEIIEDGEKKIKELKAILKKKEVKKK